MPSFPISAWPTPGKPQRFKRKSRQIIKNVIISKSKKVILSFITIFLMTSTVTDMAMPQMAGDQLVRELFKIRSNVPVIICTGHSDRIDEEKAGALGAAAYHMKPYDKKMLANMVRRVLDEKSSAQLSERQE